MSDFQRKIDLIYIHKGEFIDEIVFQHKKNQQVLNLSTIGFQKNVRS